MRKKTEPEEPLTARDSAYDNTVEIYLRDGDGACRSLIASGMPGTHIARCQDHFIAHGVCVDCTRIAGRPVRAR